MTTTIPLNTKTIVKNKYPTQQSSINSTAAGLRKRIPREKFANNNQSSTRKTALPQWKVGKPELVERRGG